MAVKKNRNFTCMDDRQLPGHFSFCRIYNHICVVHKFYECDDYFEYI